MPIRSLFTAAAAAGVLVLAGCATPAAHIANPNATVGAYRETIDLNGHLSANYQKDGQTKSISVGFDWAQRPDRIDVSLSGPLGQTIAEINVTPQSATLTQSNQPPRVAKDIDTLTAQALGWTLPVSGLRDWLQGYATDAQGKRFVASPANNNVFTRDGWNLRFAEWQDKPGPNGAPLPKLIQANRGATADSGDLSISITIFPES